MRTSGNVLSIWRPTVGLLLAAALGPVSPERAAAAVINVDTFDEVNPARCTVRNAIVSANTNANVGGCAGVGPYGTDTIVLPRGVYSLTRPHAGEDGLPIITDSLTIEGNGSTIERTLGASPPFFRLIHHMGGRLELRNLTIRGGRIEGSRARGGGILSEPGAQAPVAAAQVDDDFAPNLVLFVLILVENIVKGGLGDLSADGGALFIEFSTMLIKGSEFFDNEVNADGEDGPSVLATGLVSPAGVACGGAIFTLNSPRVDIVGTRVHGNRVRARGNLGSASGGGVCHLNNAPSEVNYLGSVIDGNETDASTGSPDPAGMAGFSGGGGFAAFGHAPELDIRFTEIRGNTARANAGPGKAGRASGGGGLAFFPAVCGSVRVTGSTFANNSAIADGAQGGAGSGVGAFGGGLAAIVPDGVNLDIADSSVTGNLARSDAPNGVAVGGGVEMSFATSPGSANLSASNTTFGGNRAEAPAAAGVAAGGGARLARRGDFTLSNSTASGNSASGTSLGGGGGAFVQSNAVFKPINSVLSGNTVASPTLASGPDCGRSVSGTVTSLGHNLFGVADLCAAIASDLVSVPAGLGAFTEGPRVRSGHFPLLPGSPALDAGDVAACPARDQLGQKRAGPCDLGAVERVPFTTLIFSGLPNGRAGAPGDLLSLFVTAINAGLNEAYRVGIDSLLPLIQSAAAAAPRALVNPLPLTFSYQTTDAANRLSGTPNTPADLLPGAAQNYILFIRPTGVFDPVDLALGVAAPNGLPLPPIRGVSTVVVSSDEPRPADVVALAATVGNNGIMDLAPSALASAAALGSGFFSVAAINLGAGGLITATVDTGGVSLPLSLFLCQTNPTTGVCISQLQPSLTVTINTSETPTFAVFGTSTDPIVFDPAVNRAFVSFKDAGGLVRGGTSVALRTVP